MNLQAEAPKLRFRVVAWTANGCLSVVSAIGAAQIALSLGIPALLGLAIGVFLGWLLTLYFHHNGFSYPGMAEAAERFNLPERVYPSVTFLSILLGPTVVFGFCALAALYPALRLLRLRPVEAMRAI